MNTGKVLNFISEVKIGALPPNEKVINMYEREVYICYTYTHGATSKSSQEVASIKTQAYFGAKKLETICNFCVCYIFLNFINKKRTDF